MRRFVTFVSFVGLVLAAALASSCAAAVDSSRYRAAEIRDVEAVETFWWPAEQQCDVRIIHRGGPTDWQGLWIRHVDPAVCGQLNAKTR